MAPAISLSVLSDALPTNISRKDCLKYIDRLEAEDGHNCQSFPKLIMVPFCCFFSIFSSRIKLETESTQSYQTLAPFAILQVCLLKSLKVAAYPPSLIGGATCMAVS
jgi:hypothetical protein